MATLENIVVLSIITVLAVLFTLRRVMSWRLVFGYALPIDLTFSVVMIMAFKGTVSGAASATLAGLLLGVALTLGKLLIGYERVTLRRCGAISWRWDKVRHPAAVTDWFVMRMGMRAWAENQINAAKERART